MRKILIALMFALVFVGCGDSGDDDLNFGGQGLNPANQVPFTGQFLGASNVTANQVGQLSLSVSPAGNATGNLNVGLVNPQTTAPVGNYPVSGDVNLVTGAFTVTGTVPGLGTFTITGNLGTGTYTFTLNGQTFAGVIRPASQGQPNPPNNGGTPPGDQGGGRLISGGALTNFVFTPANGYNGSNPPVTTNSIISGALGTGQTGQTSLSFVLTEVSVGPPLVTRTFAITVVDPNGNPIEAGDTFPLASSDGERGAVLALTDSEGTTATGGWSLVAGTTGQVEIVSLDDNSVTINFTFSGLGPNSEINQNPAQGTFDTSGTLRGNFAPNT